MIAVRKTGAEKPKQRATDHKQQNGGGKRRPKRQAHGSAHEIVQQGAVVRQTGGRGLCAVVAATAK